MKIGCGRKGYGYGNFVLRLHNNDFIHTIQEDTVEGGAAAMDRFRFVEEAGAAQDVAERNLAAEWAALPTGSAMDNKHVPGFVPPPLPPTPSLCCPHELVGHKLKTNKPQSEID